MDDNFMLDKFEKMLLGIEIWKITLGGLHMAESEMTRILTIVVSISKR